MSKSSGLGAAIVVDDASGSPQTITNDITEFSFTTPRAVQDTTGVDKSAHERLLLLADFTVSFKGVFNPAANMSHVVFSTIPSTTVVRTVKITPTSNTDPFITNECILSDYSVSRSATGELTFDVPGSLADGTTPAWTNS